MLESLVSSCLSPLDTPRSSAEPGEVEEESYGPTDLPFPTLTYQRKQNQGSVCRAFVGSWRQPVRMRDKEATNENWLKLWRSSPVTLPIRETGIIWCRFEQSYLEFWKKSRTRSSWPDVTGEFSSGTVQRFLLAVELRRRSSATDILCVLLSWSREEILSHTFHFLTC